MSSGIRGRLKVVTNDDTMGDGQSTLTSGPRFQANMAGAIPSYGISHPGNVMSDDLMVSSNGLRIRGEDYANTVDQNQLEILEAIGSGACSVVRKARYRPDGRIVAIKEINMYVAQNRHQLVEELRTLYKTNCDAIVKFYGAFAKEGSIALVLEYMDGGSLWNVLEQVGPIPERILANMTYQVLWGLCYLKHEKRIHRDIKPQNILINSRGQVKLTDFGISKELMSTLAMGSTFVGSFRYMAPERLSNAPHTYASDIWSLGIVLYEMATGRSPFANSDRSTETPIEVMQCVVNESSPQLPELAPSGEPFSHLFRAFMDRCLAKDPKDRFSAEMLLQKPWLKENGAISLTDATDNVKKWIESLQ